MVRKGLSRGDIIIIDWLPDQAVDPSLRALAPTSAALGLIETTATDSSRASVWTPFTGWTGQSQFEIPQDGATVALVAHIRLLDAWTVSVQMQREHRLALPLMIGLDKCTGLRVAFLTWHFELGPGAGQEADWDLLMFLTGL